MKSVKTSDKIYISESEIENSGRGVFALREIKKGELIETCPYIEISTSDSLVKMGTELLTYLIFFGKDKAALPLGFGAIYNHSTTPNAKYKINSKQNIIEFTALKNINKNAEITFDYKNGSDLKLWFEE